MKPSLSRSLTIIFASLTILIGLLTIIGWFNDSVLLKQVRPGFPPMRFNAALCFVLSGLSLLLSAIPGMRYARPVSNALALLVFVFALLTILQDLFRTDLGIDRLFWNNADTSAGFGRMSPITALLLILSSWCLLIVNKRRNNWIIQFVIPFLLLGSVFIAFSYVSGIRYLESFPIVITTALHASICFIFLSLGLFYSPSLDRIKYSFEKRIAMYLSVAIMMLVISFFSFNSTNNRFIESNRLVEHTRSVLFHSMKILNEAQDIETGTRGFLLTNDTALLEPYFRASKQIYKTADSLVLLTSDNHLQASRTRMIIALLDSNVAVRERAIVLKQQGNLGAVSLFMASGVEKQLMDRLRLEILHLQEAENVLLVQRKMAAQKSISSSLRQVNLLQIVLGGMLVVVFIVIYNNTRRRNKAETELKNSQTLLRSIIDNTTNPIAIRDRAGRFLLANRAVQNSLGVPEEKILGKTNADFLSGSIIEQAYASEQEVIRTGKTLESNTEAMLEDGKHYYISVRFPLFDERNKIYAVCSISTDVTSVRRAQEDLARAYTHQQMVLNALQTLMTTAMDVICVVDKNGRFIQVSAGCYALWGFTPEEMEGMSYMDLVYEEDKEPTISVAKEVMSGKTVHNFENRYRRKDGALIPVIWSSTWSAEDETMYAIARNGTQRKLDAKQLAELNIALAKRAMELQASNTELERFAYVASHDLQEPLRMVTSFLQLLEKKLDGQLDETTKKYIFFAVDGAERMKKLIQDLLQYSRVGTTRIAITEVDCKEVVEAVTRIFALSIQESQAVLKVHPLPVIRAEKSLIQQLFQNLVGNALKYSGKETPVIEIGYEEKENEWQFYVKDNGIGIDPKFFEKIFIIFQRLHNKTEYSGTGIGLAICKKIVERHGGRIWVYSAPGKGSAFHFSIPKSI
jgi:PAS domain S-box-containing protein